MDPTIKLIEAEIPRLRRYARFLARDIDRADDLVQDCLVRALARLDSWKPGTNLRAWLFTILRNGYFNERRRNSRSPMVEDDGAVSAVTLSNQYDHMALRDVSRAFLALSDEHREVLLLVAIEGSSYEEAAEVIGVPIGTVRSRTSRARHALRDAVDPESDTDGRTSPVPTAQAAFYNPI
jgi:RNA polymerase sigma-70 factor (ECF subfamily)